MRSNGCIITEYSPEIQKNSKNFPIRNRLISGLSVGTLVVEAGYRSGTSITARFCVEQNRKLFCIPNSLESKNSIGVNNLIKKGGVLVTCVDDIIKVIGQAENKVKIKKINHGQKTDEMEKELSKLEIKLIDLLKNNPQNIDELSNQINLNIDEINVILSKLEIEDYITKLSNYKYMVNKNEY